MKNKLTPITLLVFVMLLLMNMSPAITVRKVESTNYVTNPNILLASNWTWNEAGKSVAVGGVGGAVGGAVVGFYVGCPAGALTGATVGFIGGVVGGFASYAVGAAWDYFGSAGGGGGGEDISLDENDLPNFAYMYSQTSLD